jgi:phage tail sheath gpL-like
LVSPYDGNNQTLTTALIETAQGMSGPSNVQNGQFGTIAVAANQSVAGISATSLFKYDTQYFSGCSLPDSSGAAPQSLGALASAYAAILGGNLIPFNPVNGIVIGNIAAPVNQSDWITVGAGLESEAILGQGWTPLRVLPNGTVAIVRSVTARLTLNGNGVTPVLSYFDVQDFQVLYYFRRTVAARFAQPDFQNVKASSAAATNTKNVVVQLMSDFEDQNMFQNVAGLAPLVQVQRNATDRSRFDVFIPVNVIPGLDVIATNVQAGTIGDSFTV